MLKISHMHLGISHCSNGNVKKAVGLVATIWLLSKMLHFFPYSDVMEKGGLRLSLGFNFLGNLFIHLLLIRKIGGLADVSPCNILWGKFLYILYLAPGVSRTMLTYVWPCIIQNVSQTVTQDSFLYLELSEIIIT